LAYDVCYFLATIFDNPAYVNIAPCPCDLHVGSCDVDCCCDTVCMIYNHSAKLSYLLCRNCRSNFRIKTSWRSR